jgi:alkanesulfonate monooxygenase SsuD/methylene tetrahydromethanopterin reductase-like flavin-dependent oxidoreductase (luciferase family)
VKLGILVEVEEGLDWDAWRGVYSAAERLGFDSVWLSDHLESPWGTRRGLETWTALAVAAAETRRITLGPLVSPVTFREPAIIASMAEGLHRLSYGRFIVGLGLGWNSAEHATAHITFPSVAERARRLVATLERIRCEAPEIPMLIGGSGRRTTLPLVARYAEQWNVTTASAETFSAANQHLDGLCTAVGRVPGTVERSIACGVLVGSNASDLAARAERMRRCVPQVSSVEAAREMGWLVGTADEVVTQLRGLAAVGVQWAALGHYDVADVSTLELLAHSVLPHVA